MALSCCLWPREVDVLVEGHSGRMGLGLDGEWPWGPLGQRKCWEVTTKGQAGKDFPSAGNIGLLTLEIVSTSLCTDQS